MPISKCIVRLKDCHNTEHSVEVYAESLYEAVVRGLGRLQDVGWESDTNETIKRVEVKIHQEPTRHIVDVRERYVKRRGYEVGGTGIPRATHRAK
jgi:hypothetical protein